VSGEGKGEFERRLIESADSIEDTIPRKSALKILDEFRREIPYRHTEGHTYIDPVKLPEGIKKWLGPELKEVEKP